MCLTTLYKIFYQMQEMFYITNKEEFRQRFLEFDQNYNVIEFDNIYTYITNVIELLRDFLLNKTTEYYNYHTSIQLWLYLYALFMMTFILGYMWWKYVEYLGELLHQTKYILGIFEIDTILLNPYMVALLERLRKFFPYFVLRLTS